RRPHLELLEDRAVPATIASAANVLTYAASVGVNNNLTVSISGSNLVFNDTAETITTGVAGATGSGTSTVTIPSAAASCINLLLGAGTDAIAGGGTRLTTQALTISQTGSLLNISGAVSTPWGNVTISQTGPAGSVLNIGAPLTTTGGNVGISGDYA